MENKNKTQKITSKNISRFAHIDDSVVIEAGAKIYPNVYVLGDSKIRAGSILFPNTIIEDSVIGENCVIKASHIEQSEVENNVQIGPFAHIRPGSVIESNCKIGNFVEIKASRVGEGTKTSHLAYVGDAKIGKNCNIGCGVIFANYNGKTKNKTIVEDDCFIGSNSNIIAPVVVSKGTYICAGTTLTTSTKKHDFVIGRCREVVKPNRAKNYFEGS